MFLPLKKLVINKVGPSVFNQVRVQSELCLQATSVLPVIVLISNIYFPFN